MTATSDDISKMQSQIDALQCRKSVLSTSLLANINTSKILSTQHGIDQAAQSNVANALEACADSNSTVFSHIVRSTTGVTPFYVQDPEPRTMAAKPILGIRLDTFSPDLVRFEQPYFLLFSNPREGWLKLHKHTIPECISMRHHIAKLTLASTRHLIESDSLEIEQLHLRTLAHNVRVELMAMAKRKSLIDQLDIESKHSNPQQYQIKRIEVNDPSSTRFNIILGNEMNIRLHLKNSGHIDRVVVSGGSHENAMKHKIERMLTQNSPRLEQIPSLLQSLG